MSEPSFGNPEIIEIETDILLVGGGMAACGAAYEAKIWAGDDVKVTLVDKAAMDRSGAVAMGLSAINTYLGQNTPEDYCRYVSADLMGITRDDLVYDVGRHVDDSVNLFEEWGLPIWKELDDGHRVDGAQWQNKGGKTLKDGGKPVPISELGWGPWFRLVYRPPALEDCAHLGNAGKIWRGRLLSRAFNGGGMD